MSVPDAVALSVSDITPMASLLVISPAVLAANAGTGGLDGEPLRVATAAGLGVRLGPSTIVLMLICQVG